MNARFVLLSLFSIVVLVSGCAGPEARYADEPFRYGSSGSNDGYYGVIDSIATAPAGRGGPASGGTVMGGAARGGVAGHEIGKSSGDRDAYAIRVRFDDRSYRTVTQDSLDGLRVGDSVRIESDRVRRY